MIKECSVILNNEAVTVVKYDDTDIQFPSIHKDVKTVFVKYEDGRYSIIENKSMQNATKSKRKGGISKKTTIIENVDKNIEEVTNTEK